SLVTGGAPRLRVVEEMAAAHGRVGCRRTSLPQEGIPRKAAQAVDEVGDVRQADARVETPSTGIAHLQVAERRLEIALEAGGRRNGGGAHEEAAREKRAEASVGIGLPAVAVARTEEGAVGELERLDLHAIAVPVQRDHRIQESRAVGEAQVGRELAVVRRI